MIRRSLIDHLMLAAAKTHSRVTLRRFMNAARSATRVQDAVLMSKIKRNADSDYGHAFGFGSIGSYEDFRSRVPLQTYVDFKPYIQRARQGEHTAMFGGGQQVRMFAMTSGTTGEPKYIPVTEAFLQEFKAGWNAFGVKALMDHPGMFLRPILQVTSRMDETSSEAGIPCGAITGLMAATQKSLVRKYYLTPLCVAHVDDALSRYYTIMRLSVAVEDVAFVVTANPATPLRLAKTANEHAAALVRDIHDGTLREDLKIPAHVRDQLKPRLKADPQRGRYLDDLLRRHGQLLPRHYWRLGFMCNWTGGTLRLFLREFPKYFGDTPVRDIGLIASEGRMTIPIEDGTPSGILDVTSNFYEFIPVSQYGKSAPDCLRSHEVQPGKEYYIVLTNSAGLYRYSIGDRVRITGFVGEAPMLEFLDKGDHICSMAGEKLSEHQVVSAVNEVAASMNFELSSYVLAPRWSDPPYYVLHVETQGAEPPLSAFARRVDERFGVLNLEYQSKRKSLRLDPLQINRVPPGFFESRDQRLSSRFRRNNEQYKHQFIIAEPDRDADFPTLSPRPCDTQLRFVTHADQSSRTVEQ